MEINKGHIYGLIGQNGAGKTTLMRIIAGLVKPQDGQLAIFGEEAPRTRELARKRIGTLIEGPALYPQLSAYGNLNIDRIQKGIPGKGCIHRALKLVGLEHTKRKKTKHFSLGMKQRLGIAMALLSEPELLILDEPVNGLDPMGIIEIRELLLRLNREEGVTILISSHILSELDQLANHYGIIHRGILLEEISAQTLHDGCKHYLHIQVDRVDQATTVIEERLGTTDYVVRPDGVIHLYTFVEESARVATELSVAGVAVTTIMPKGDSLESYFTKKVGGAMYV